MMLTVKINDHVVLLILTFLLFYLPNHIFPYAMTDEYRHSSKAILYSALQR